MKNSATNLLEEEAWAKGFKLVAGIDEAGRGPLAGPVVAGAVVFKRGKIPDGIKDSKQLSSVRREELFFKICSAAVAVGVGIVNEKVIDRINILRATYRAMQRAVAGLNIKPDFMLIDGMRVPQIAGHQKAIPDGDRISVSIAAASIIAKVTRDRIMVEQDSIHPQYGFAKHKGYGTRAHINALAKYGPCKIHRFSFRPVRESKRSAGKTKIELGERGESLAVDFLRKQGYRIAATNFRSPLGEVDVVAQDGNTTVFIEVKTRRSVKTGMPQESVTLWKQGQILKTALVYLKRNNLLQGNYRFDVVSVVIGSGDEVRNLELIKNAFEPDARYG